MRPKTSSAALSMVVDKLSVPAKVELVPVSFIKEVVPGQPPFFKTFHPDWHDTWVNEGWTVVWRME